MIVCVASQNSFKISNFTCLVFVSHDQLLKNELTFCGQNIRISKAQHDIKCKYMEKRKLGKIRVPDGIRTHDSL